MQARQGGDAEERQDEQVRMGLGLRVTSMRFRRSAGGKPPSGDRDGRLATIRFVLRQILKEDVSVRHRSAPRGGSKDGP